jgi:hypothetical protein
MLLEDLVESFLIFQCLLLATAVQPGLNKEQFAEGDSAVLRNPRTNPPLPEMGLR